MAKTIATLGGVALEPGVSRNRRWYTAEHIAGAVAEARKRLARGDQPMVMLSHHEAGDDSLRIAAALRSVSLTDDGRIRWEADIPDTETGRQIASLADTTDGKPAFLEGVSIRGRWTGRVQKVRAPDGDFAEQGQGLLLDGLDFTHKPGVPGARIDTFAWAKDGASETTESVLITESVQEARVTITEDAPLAPDGVREAVRALLPLASPHILANGICVTCPAVAEAAKDPSKPYGDVTYADNGYQKDGKKRYPLDSAAHIRAAWRFIGKAKNAALYSDAQLKRIKGRIKAAMGSIGAKVAAEGWSIDPAVEVTEALAEYYGGDPECAGSYSLSATNGPTTVTVCSYGLDPADLQQILAQACAGAGMALKALDPDMDADIDLPGDDPGESAGADEEPVTEADLRAAVEKRRRELAEMESLMQSAPGFGRSNRTGGRGSVRVGPRPAAATETRQDDEPVTETAPQDPAPEPAADREGTEEPAMSEATTTETVAPAPAAASAVPEDLVLKYQKKLAKKEAARRIAAGAPAESAPAPAAAAAVTETDDERIARIVEARLAAARPAPAAPAVTETEDERINRIVEERLVRERQEITAAGGGPARKGLVAEHAGPGAASGEIPAGFPMKNGVMIPQEEWTAEQRQVVGEQLVAYVDGARANR